VRQSAEATLTTIDSILEKKEVHGALSEAAQRQPTATGTTHYPGGTTSKSTLRPHSADTTGEQ
jgi:hypothetical protein